MHFAAVHIFFLILFFCNSHVAALVTRGRHWLQRKLTLSLIENYIQHLACNSSSNFLIVDMEGVYSFSGHDLQLYLMNGSSLTAIS